MLNKVAYDCELMNLNTLKNLEEKHVWKINALDVAHRQWTSSLSLSELNSHHFMYAERRSNGRPNLYADLWTVNCTSETHLSTIIIENYFNETEKKKFKQNKQEVEITIMRSHDYLFV